MQNIKPWSSWQLTDELTDKLNKELTAVKPNTGEHELYLLNLNTIGSTNEVVKLNLIPNGVSEAYKQRIISETPYGTYSPMYFYAGGEGKTISFDFELHEDENHELVTDNRNNTVDRSIYALVEKLKRMNAPTVKQNLLIEPSVYIQLGSQFAGKGFLNLNFDFNKPFRNDRYVRVKVTLTFTFIDEYDDETVDYTTPAKEYIRPEGLTFDIEELFNNTAIRDFFSEDNPYDMFVTQDFAFRKLEGFLNALEIKDVGQHAKDIISGDLPSSDYEPAKFTDVLRFSTDLDDSPQYQTTGSELYKLTLDFTYIITSEHLTTQAKVNNLNKIKNKAEKELQLYLDTYDTDTAIEAGAQVVRDFITQVDTHIQIFEAVRGSTL